MARERSDTALLRKWSIAGFVAIVLLGTLYHYFYPWTNESRILAAFVPVNESVWEHLKLGLWSTITYSFVEYPFLHRKTNNYFFAKAVGITALNLGIVLFYYSYTAILGDNHLFMDISSYVFGAALCQWLCYRLYQAQGPSWRNRLGLTLLVLTCLLFAVFTFYPPHYPLFEDGNTHSYGIEAQP